MLLDISDRFAEGGFADLFNSPDAKTVYKLFRRFRADPEGRGIRALFEAEKAAYVRAQEHEEIRVHVPSFYGNATIEEVRAQDGSSLSERYQLNCCYCLERVPGKGLKYGWLPDHAKPAAEALAERFEAAGINHVRDADFFAWQTPHSMILVDIATYDVVASSPQLFRVPDAGA
jgi:hypothetical protein